jgi:hypothetical protein
MLCPLLLDRDRLLVLLEHVLGGVIRLQRPKPGDQSPDRLASQGVDPTLAEWMDDDQAGPLERLQVLGDLRLAQAERRGDLTDGSRGSAQQLDDPQPVGLRECRQ